MYFVMTAVSTYLPYIQMILAIILVALILMQRSESGSGGAFGGNDNWNAAYHTRRGLEKIIFNTTIVISIIFAVLSLISILL
jgi:preprotein translocase subunit SecG